MRVGNAAVPVCPKPGEPSVQGTDRGAGEAEDVCPWYFRRWALVWRELWSGGNGFWYLLSAPGRGICTVVQGGGGGRALLDGEGVRSGQSRSGCRAVTRDVKAVVGGGGAVTGGWKCGWGWCWGMGMPLG